MLLRVFPVRHLLVSIRNPDCRGFSIGGIQEKKKEERLIAEAKRRVLDSRNCSVQQSHENIKRLKLNGWFLPVGEKSDDCYSLSEVFSPLLNNRESTI